MKEKYFLPETIDTKALDILEKVKNAVNKIKKREFLPQKSALIVIDMQKYFCDKNSHAYIPSVDAVIPKIKLLVDAYKAKNLPVIFTKHLNTVENAGMMSKWWKDIITGEDKSCNIISEFDAEDFYIIEKPQYDAFYDTPLENFLNKNNIDQLVITGVMTDLCCETTARSAFVRGFETFLPVDSTAAYNEIFHTSSFINLAHGFSTVTLSNEIFDKVKETNNYE